MFEANEYEIETQCLFENRHCIIYTATKNSKKYIAKFYPAIYQRQENETKIHNKLKEDKNYSKYIVPLVEVFSFRDYNVYIYDRGEYDMFDFMYENEEDFHTLLEICIRVIDCIDFIHSYGIIHLDIKPENVVIFHENGKKIPKLIDFEYAQFLEGKEFIQHKTLMGTKGSLDLLLIEWMDYYGHVFYSKSNDVYSIAVLIYEIFYGDRFIPPKKYKRGDLLISRKKNIDKLIRDVLDKILIYDSASKRLNLTELKNKLLIIQKDKDDKKDNEDDKDNKILKKEAVTGLKTKAESI